MLRRHDVRYKQQTVRPGIVADDLSGAMDTGLQFAKRGLETWVALAEDDFSAAEALAVSTESRDLTADEAKARVKEAARYVRGRSLYKKIDSTLRGNPGVEIIALMRESGYEKAIITPAFPEQERIVNEGQLFVSGRPLEKTDLARDFPWPLSSSQVRDILLQGITSLCSHVELRKVERGPWGLIGALESQIADLIAVDATNRKHLDIIAEAILLAEGRWLPCGSAGLAQSLAALLSPRIAHAAPPTATENPVLVVAGSRQKATAVQIRRAEAKLHLAVIPFLSSGGTKKPEAAVESAQSSLKERRSVILTTMTDAFMPGSQKEIAEGLAALALGLCEKGDLAGLVLTGGEVALAVCRALEARAIRILAEIEPGVPLGILQGGRTAGMRVITKAGGFGSPEVLIKAIQYLQGKA